MRFKERLLSISWWLPVVIVDMWLVMMSTIFPHLPEFSLKWSLFNPFNLALEMNLAAWWASISLLLVGLIAYELYSTHKRLRIPWFILALILTGLSLDEFGSIHERAGIIGDWAVYGPAILVGSVMYGYALWQLYKVPTQRAAYFGGFICRQQTQLDGLRHWHLHVRAGYARGGSIPFSPTWRSNH